MKYQKTDITLLAAPFGFGPLGKALSIAYEFEKQGYTTKILGDDIAQEIVKTCGFIAGSYQYREALDLGELNTRLVLSCLDVSTPITKSGIPLVSVDSLFWLRGSWERLPSGDADLYLAQRFFMTAPKEAQDRVKNRLQTVDAILPPWAFDSKPQLEKDANLVVFYPGGMRSPYLDLEYQYEYLAWGVDVICQSLEAAKTNPANFVAFLPAQVLSSPAAKQIVDFGGKLQSKIADPGLLLSKTHSLVMAPGIEIMLEACAMGLSPHYLPAFNGSHIPQLMAYRQANVGKELCPSYADELRKFELNTDNLSKLSIDIAKQNSKRLFTSRYKAEAIMNLTNALQQRSQPIEKYPLGTHGASQVVSHALALLRQRTFDHQAQ